MNLNVIHFRHLVRGVTDVKYIGKKFSCSEFYAPGELESFNTISVYLTDNGLMSRSFILSCLKSQLFV